jgi:EAL domain-containing protein (putative c-di-GMP-specific phosphodiesterase class I)
LLELEITESIAMQDHAHAIETMRQLRDLGVRLSLDDFGTGYSSLSYLRRFPVNTLKVDRSFVKDVASDKTAAGVVAAIISVAHELGLRVVAEGVETEAQLERLRVQRCDTAQGYFLGRPVPLSQLPASFANVERLWSKVDAKAPRAKGALVKGGPA